jgi:hypothetical protein
LRNELLTDYFSHLITEPTDSAFVQGFYKTDCSTGDNNTYFSHDLLHTDPELNQKLQVNRIYFQTSEKFNWNENPEDQYNLQYYTWASHPEWATLFDLFQARQDEIFILEKRYGYHREVTYRWFLFTWIKTFELFESGNRA